MKLRVPDSSSAGRGATGAKRGKVVSYTRQSAARHRSLVFQLNRDACSLPQFVTLTYPKEFESARASKRDLDAMGKSILRAHPAAVVIWKLEPQKRGAPHFHLLVVGAALTPEWVAEAWHRIAGHGDRNHLRWHLGNLGGVNRPCVQTASSWDRVGAYLSKYVTKLVDASEWHEPGKFWGVIGRKNLVKYRTIVETPITSAVALRLGRIIRKYHGSRRSKRWRLVMKYPGADGVDRVHSEALETMLRRAARVDPSDGRVVEPATCHLVNSCGLAADLRLPVNRKFARAALAKASFVGGAVRLAWCGGPPRRAAPVLMPDGTMKTERQPSSPRTLLIPASEADSLVRLCQKNDADEALELVAWATQTRYSRVAVPLGHFFYK